jgi:hypothetical protein
VADISSASAASALPAGVKGLVWLGLCHGADASFTSTLTSFVGNSKVFGFYLMDEPSPSSCPAANLLAESDWIHAHVPGTVTFVVLMNMSATKSPTYQNTYNPANSHVDLYGLDPYPCRTELGNSCDYNWIPLAVLAAESAGVPLADIVPVYQAFGGGNWGDDGGGQYLMPSAAQEAQILQTWGTAVPTAAMDYAYSWGSQDGDTSLSTSSSVELIFANHNAS